MKSITIKAALLLVAAAPTLAAADRPNVLFCIAAIIVGAIPLVARKIFFFCFRFAHNYSV